jgi:DNA-binding response OmpR family regulator
VTVLVIIGHDPSTHRRVARALKAEGHPVVCTATLGRGLSAVIRHEPGVVLLDASATGLAMLGVLRGTKLRVSPASSSRGTNMRPSHSSMVEPTGTWSAHCLFVS